MISLIELAERCEKASGPDKELDFLVWAAFNGVTEITDPAEGHPMTPGKGGRVEGRGPDGKWHLYGWVDPGKVQRNWQPYGGSDAYPAYTASLDAAMTLVPEGWEAAIYCAPKGALGVNANVQMETEGMRQRVHFCPIDGIAATPALALAAACLRAKADA